MNNNTQIAERQSHIDRSLIRENLKLSPRQRLEQLEQLNHDLNTLRAAVKQQLRQSK